MNHIAEIIEKEHLSKFAEILNQLGAVADAENTAQEISSYDSFNEVINKSIILNPWFTRENIRMALLGLGYMVRPEALEKWLDSHDFSNNHESKRVGLILAGNIPMVGFHDIFSVALSGHKAVVKLSGQDKLLLPFLFRYFHEATGYNGFDIEWFEDRLPEVDAVIATGSNNTSRYFEYYFGKYPNIIRKNRSSVAILSGNETENELKALGADIFSFFGLGCRNVSKIYVPEDFEIDRFFKGIYDFNDVVNHNKYANNYDYFRALWMLNSEDLLDNGFMILRPHEALASPIGTVFYERYTDIETVKKHLDTKQEEIQCIVSQDHVPFGKSQQPELWDYADGVNTMEFLLNLK